MPQNPWPRVENGLIFFALNWREDINQRYLWREVISDEAAGVGVHLSAVLLLCLLAAVAVARLARRRLCDLEQRSRALQVADFEPEISVGS